MASARASATRCRWPPESWCGIAIAKPVELHEPEQLLHARGDLGARPLPDAEREGDVLLHGHVPEERVVLEHDAHVPLAGAAGGDVLAAVAHLARVRRPRAPR